MQCNRGSYIADIRARHIGRLTGESLRCAVGGAIVVVMSLVVIIVGSATVCVLVVYVTVVANGVVEMVVVAVNNVAVVVAKVMVVVAIVADAVTGTACWENRLGCQHE